MRDHTIGSRTLANSQLYKVSNYAVVGALGAAEVVALAAFGGAIGGCGSTKFI